jgi:putative ABC transport system permease protein
MNKLPVAWKQLSKQKMKTLVAIAGITFADMLMFLQLGIKDALFDSAVQFHKSLRGEIVLVSRRYQSLVALNRFPERRLYQVSGFAGVKSVTPIYLDRSDWKNPENGQTWSMFTIGFNPREQVVNLEGVAENQQALTFPDVVLFDRGSRSEYGAIAAELQAGKTVTTEVENRRVQAVGLFKLGTSFGINGNLITSDSNFLRLMGNKRKKSAIDVGLVKLESGADREKVLKNLRENLPDDVKVLIRL